MDDLYSRGLSGIVGVFFKSSAEDADGFAFQVEVEGLEDSEEEVLFPVFVNFDDSVPVIGYFCKTFPLS